MAAQGIVGLRRWPLDRHASLAMTGGHGFGASAAGAAPAAV
jgi:hypothetical protein